jgi:hypothetical protein
MRPDCGSGTRPWGANRWASSTYQVQGLGIGAVQLLGEVGEEARARADGHRGGVDHAGEGLGGDYLGQPGAAAFVDIEIGVRTAEYHDGIGGGAAVGKHAQAPPDAGRINDADASVSLNEAFGESFGSRRLAAAGLSYDADVVAEGLVWERLSPMRYYR